MKSQLSRVYQGSTRISRVAAFLAFLLFAAFQLANLEVAIHAQVVMAIIALAVGIPHGAIDHLITIPRESRRKFLAFIIIYTFVAIMAALAIANWNLIGFQLVLVMSALHFGFGDSAFINEGKAAFGEKKYSSATLFAYAIPAGFLPVILPLTDERTFKVLSDLNPALTNWAGSLSETMRTITLTLAIVSIIYLALLRNFDLATDLLLLGALSFFAPPLIAFAIYFGFWHAIRHTARLVPKLPKAMIKVEEGSTAGAFWAAIFPGLYAILGIFILGIFIVTGTFSTENGSNISNDFLWVILVIIWALTVPHVATTARFDRAAFKNSPRP